MLVKEMGLWIGKKARTMVFYKLYSKTDGSPVFYGKSSKSNVGLVMTEMLDLYRKYLNPDLYGRYFKMFEILKNRDFKIEEILESELKPNTGFSDPVWDDHKNINIKNIYKSVNNKVKYEQYIKENRMAKKEIIVGKREQLASECKKWREDNKDMLSSKIQCACGGKYSYSNKSGHLKTKKHIAHSKSLSSSVQEYDTSLSQSDGS
jgi:hypothetical protein